MSIFSDLFSSLGSSRKKTAPPVYVADTAINPAPEDDSPFAGFTQRANALDKLTLDDEVTQTPRQQPFQQRMDQNRMRWEAIRKMFS